MKTPKPKSSSLDALLNADVNEETRKPRPKSADLHENNQNGIAVQFLINNRLFREPFAVETLWKFPFIPHAGESVDGKLWINASDFSPEKAEKNLTDLGHALLKQSGKALNQWLLDLSLTIGFVENVAYLCDDDDKLLILIVLTDLEIQTKTKYTRRQNNIIGNNICGSNIQINKTIM